MTLQLFVPGVEGGGFDVSEVELQRELRIWTIQKYKVKAKSLSLELIRCLFFLFLKD